VTVPRLVLSSAVYHWRTNLAIVLGVAVAVSVLSGALLVGDSVRGSLRELALGRLGRTESVVASAGFFREDLSNDIATHAAPGGSAPESSPATAPLLVANGFVTHEASGRRAAGVNVYGVDDRFWTFHGHDPAEGVHLSPALARELGAAADEVILLRLRRPSEIPLESLFGRKEDIGRTIRLTLGGVLPRERLGEFALRPQQSEVRAIVAPLGRIQRDLDVEGMVNTVLIGGTPDGGDVSAAVRLALRLEDLGVRVETIGDPPMLVVESATGILNDALERASRLAGQKLGLTPLPIFTYLANTIRKDDRAIPYSLVAAVDLETVRALNPAVDAFYPPPLPASAPSGPIVVNEWAARELGAVNGDTLRIDYFVWDAASGLRTEQAAFTLEGIVPIAGFAADRRLAPDYPGVTGAESLADWDPPFPIDLSRVRRQDERYWDLHRTTPKAFIEYRRGRELWSTRYGGSTSIRFAIAPSTSSGQAPGSGQAPSTGSGQAPSTGSGPGREAHALLEDLRRELMSTLSPQAMGVTVYPARRLALEASTGATDFGEYFTYFSFFLVVSALLLAVLFFRLGVEQRLKQIGVLRATGFTTASVRGMLLAEAVALAAAGSAIGMAGAIAYGGAIMYGLRTWWIGAVGTTLLELHVSPLSLAAGAFGGIVASALCVVVSLRAVSRLSPRTLLTAHAIDAGSSIDPRRARRRRRASLMLAAAGVLLVAAGFFDRRAQAGAFFGAGAAWLVAWMFALSAWLRMREVRLLAGRGLWPIARLGFRSAAFRPARSVLSATLIAAAAFIIVSVDAFRREGGEIAGDPQSGTGGFVLIGRSELPLVHDPNDPRGREALAVDPAALAPVRFSRFRLRAGEDASCLNLYRPTNPTIVAAEREFIDSGRFTFASSLAETPEERANPWLLLRRQLPDGAVPVVADATSLQYVLHAAVGDVFTMDAGGPEPLRLRFVGALSDSVLQGELVMGEEHFLRLFPNIEGYRLFLIDAAGVADLAGASSLAAELERALAPFGFDAVTAAERLASFHRVENTYLSTFQALGGLGLLLGTIGLATVLFRNVLERRRELALLRAVGYDARRVAVIIMAEAVLLLAAGLAAGAICAALAIAPAWLGRGGALPGIGLAVLLAGVLVAGLVSSWIATRAALRGNVLAALRAE
jgi:hypothetical protein